MLMDKGWNIASAQAVTASAATTDYVDTVKAGTVYQSDGYFVFTCNEDAAASGSATVNFQVQSADDNSFSTNLTTHFDSGAIGKAALLNGKWMLKIPVPMYLRRYVRGYFVVATGPLTAGKFSFNLVPDVPLTING